MDESVGISIAKVLDRSDENIYVTKILPNKSVNPHYHKKGGEFYFICSGSGQMKLKYVATNEEKSFDVKEGDIFEIQNDVSHELINTGDTDMILLFGCDPDHLNDDRYTL